MYHTMQVVDFYATVSGSLYIYLYIYKYNYSLWCYIVSFSWLVAVQYIQSFVKKNDNFFMQV